MLHHLVAFLEILLAGHSVGLRRNLFKVPLACKKEVDRIVFHRFLFGEGFDLLVHQQQTAARLCIVFDDIFQFADDDAVDAL